MTFDPTPRRPLRLWPGVLALTLQWLIRFGVPLVVPDTIVFGLIGAILFGFVIALWWLFFSRARWLERLAAVVLVAAGLALTPRILHPSIATGMMGFMFYMYSIPVLCLALVLWAVATRGLSDRRVRLASMAAAIMLACGVFALIRTNGITGEAEADFAWRWSATSEERLLAQVHEEPEELPLIPTAAKIPDSAPSEPVGGDSVASATPADTTESRDRPAPPSIDEPATPPTEPTSQTPAVGWPGFRGPGRDGVIHDVRIATDWTVSPPVEMWRRPIGPGWSSFAVSGRLVYTQEQRGDEEVVSCYDIDTGEPVWRHQDATRFWESNAGPGPRATPTLSDGRVYTLGATGILNALDAGSGAVVWSRNAASDTETEVPGWGFASSPLVVDDLVVVATAGKLVAYERATGEPRWFGPTDGWGYSSPQLATIDGVAQILLLNGVGAISVAPADGAKLWEHVWKGDGIVQPGLTAEDDVLIGSGSGISGATGMRRIALKKGTSGWSSEERWTTISLKPYFNDFVVHAGHAYGFDGGILACVDLDNGKRKWKGGRFGHGQLVLLADQDLLLVLSEQGELGLVEAVSDHFKELARFPAIEGKTWNHPVLVGDILLVRNDREMAAFRLTLAGR